MCTSAFKLIPQTMPYQGSKRRIAKQILDYFPKKAERVVEPFAGSAAISVNSLSNGYAKKVWVNDMHEPLVKLWIEILNNPAGLASDYSKLWHEQIGHEREFFDTVRARFNMNHNPVDLLYLLARCVKAAVRYNNNGEFNNSPDNRRKGAKPDVMKKRIMITASILSGKTKLTSMDYKDVLQKCTSKDLIYLDPPYQGTCNNHDRRYCNHVSYDEFCKQLEYLNNKEIPFILSYDGKTGNKAHGKTLPKSLGLKRVTICVGRSTQATLLGRTDDTYESLYISPYVV